MFEQAGHRVRTSTRLSPRIDRVDVIVWVPDSFRPPSREAEIYLEHWLAAAPDRTLVYVGRDFDAAPRYWERVLPAALPATALEVQRRWATSRSEYDAQRRRLPAEYDGPWFTFRRSDARREVRSLQGPLSEGIDATRAEIVLRGQFALPPAASLEDDDGHGELLETVPLLTSADELVVGAVARPYWDGSQVLVVANGSFLLNLPLVNHQHRKLAGRLIGQCGPPGQSVVFLESGPDGVRISDRETETHHLVRAFTQWPINCILMHLMGLGIVYCVFAFPIFGRPRELAADSPSDFGKHVDALGGLLERTGDAAYAQARLRHYQQTVRRDQAASPPVHAAGPEAPSSLSSGPDREPTARSEGDRSVTAASPAPSAPNSAKPDAGVDDSD
jgi:hypothetical protein